MNAKKKSNPSVVDFIESVAQVLLASGGTVAEFNVRQSANAMGSLFAALADEMDAIYGPNSFALATELRDWSQAFTCGDCDPKVAAGDADGMAEAVLRICWHAVECGLSLGVDMQKVRAELIKRMRDESGT
jgi:hypothetical protein